MKILTNYNFNGNEIQNVRIQNLALAPDNPVKGQVYFNTTSNRLFVWDGTTWVGTDGNDATLNGAQIVGEINSSTSIIDDDNLSANVNSAIAKAHDTHAISDVTGLQSALDGKVNSTRVLTDVPLNAKFTDTVTTINGKTGAISKSDIVALGIPSQDTVYTLPVAGANLGGVKSGGDITIDANGVISVADDSHNHIISNIDGLQSALDGKETPAGATAKASVAENNAKSYTDTKIADLLGSAPETLDTLNELAIALGNDPNFATTITNQLALRTKKYTVAVGNGSATSYTVTHNLNTRDVVVMIRETASPYAQVFTDVEMTTVNTVSVKFAVAPTTSQYTVTVIG